MDKNKILLSVFGTIGCVGICVGTGIGVAYAIKTSIDNNRQPGGDDSSIMNQIPNIKDTNLNWTPQNNFIYNISTPVMFTFIRGNNINFLNGTAWVFDKTISADQNGIVTYYLATNLHVINLWEGNENNPIDKRPIENVRLCLANKNADAGYPEYSQQTIKNDKNLPTYKWPYINIQNKTANLNKWYMSNFGYNWAELNDDNKIDLPTENKINFNSDLSLGAQNGFFDYSLYPQIGIENNVDLGIIQLKINQSKINNFPFLMNFNDLINNRIVSQIYNLKQEIGVPINATIAGYPAMTDNTFNYSTWNSWTNQNSDALCYMSKGNGNRGYVSYQELSGSNKSEIYYGNATNANLNHGSSGSMVINNETGLIEGIYWGGIGTINKATNTKTFYGRFVPFDLNGILKSWANQVNNAINNFGSTFIQNALIQNRRIVSNISQEFINKLIDFLTRNNLFISKNR